MERKGPKLSLAAESPEAYLGIDDVIDRDDAVAAFGKRLLSGSVNDIAFARTAYEWVRDEVAHSYDIQDPRVTLRASEVLRERVGLCYSKSHLLAALLRCGGVPAGLCYQRLADGEGGHVLHGLVAAHLEGDWHRLDVRGNIPGLDAQFSLGDERLAWTTNPDAEEIDYMVVAIAPAQVVVDVLTSARDILTAVLPSGLR